MNKLVFLIIFSILLSACTRTRDSIENELHASSYDENVDTLRKFYNYEAGDTYRESELSRNYPLIIDSFISEQERNKMLFNEEQFKKIK